MDCRRSLSWFTVRAIWSDLLTCVPGKRSPGVVAGRSSANRTVCIKHAADCVFKWIRMDLISIRRIWFRWLFQQPALLVESFERSELKIPSWRSLRPSSVFSLIYNSIHSKLDYFQIATLRNPNKLLLRSSSFGDTSNFRVLKKV